jgi:hypothetical protein
MVAEQNSRKTDKHQQTAGYGGEAPVKGESPQSRTIQPLADCNRRAPAKRRARNLAFFVLLSFS